MWHQGQIFNEIPPHFEHAFATVHMDEMPFNYSIERARLSAQTRKWLGDSGASSHCSANKDLFVYLEQIEDTPVLTGNGYNKKV